MSGLYNDLCGIDPLAPYVLNALDLHPSMVPRLRDAFVKLDQKKRSYDLAVLTRTGGPNRSSFTAENEALRQHPHFIRDEDYLPLDDTYAVFLFAIPQARAEFFTQVIKSDQVGPEPGDRWRSMMAAMTSGKDTPESRRAKEVGERILAPIMDALKGSR